MPEIDPGMRAVEAVLFAAEAPMTPDEIGAYVGPEVDLKQSLRLLADQTAASDYRKRLTDAGLTISALSCHGNPLHPDRKIAQAYDDVFRKTVCLAKRMEVPVVVTIHDLIHLSQPSRNPFAPFYGWLTWLNADGHLFADASRESYFMFGAGGHTVWVEPTRRAVIVVDEHGGLEGIITLEDLLEEIVGDISDEHDEEVNEQITEVDEGTYVLDGGLAVRDLNRRLKLSVPESEVYTTVGGFLMTQAGHVLKPGEVVQHDGLIFKVERVEKRRVMRVRMEIVQTEGEEVTDELNRARSGT